MKPKDTIYKYSIKLDFKTNDVKQTSEKFIVIGVNDLKLCINDYSFTSIYRKKPYRGSNERLFNEVTIFDTSKWNTSFYDYIEGNLYTSTSNSKIAYKRIKKELEKYIYKAHGRYCNAISILEMIKI